LDRKLHLEHADDVLRDLYVRGKYRDVILPMTVPRRLDAVLEPTKKAAIEMKAALDQAKITNQDTLFAEPRGKPSTIHPNLRCDLRARASQQQFRTDFEAYLDGFSPNVQEILDCFEFRNQIPRLSRADALGTLIEKFLDPAINLSPDTARNADGTVRLPGLDNHAMGTIFEELVRRFNEENNEEVGEHWTPRDAVKLMARLVLLPVADQIESGAYLLYDSACGTGGMLTVAEEILKDLAAARGKEIATHLYGQVVNAETYAIAEADFLLKGEGEAPDNLVGGPDGQPYRMMLWPHASSDEWLRIGPRTPPNSKRNRNATHPVNAMLNYGLAVLERQVRLAVIVAGLDPAIGYTHAQHEKRSALVLDLMEPLRPLVDRLVIGLLQAQPLSPTDFILREDGVCRLAPQFARTVATKSAESIAADAPVEGLIGRL
jgi:hypothetical protein